MDNVTPLDDYRDDIPLVELPREEVLARLYTLIGAYGMRSEVLCPFSTERASEGLGTPHAFRFGCCRDAARADAA